MFGLLTGLLTSYGLYIACSKVMTAMIFNSTYSGTVDHSYFFMVNVFEIMSLLFVRTRSTIKYLPKFLLILNVMYLMYVSSFVYAC